ncbi:MAG: thermonuclease family protein [Phycisphaerae bacterium]|nr:thermonuclease family protein [Phycisphaerae bacterium]
MSITSFCLSAPPRRAPRTVRRAPASARPRPSRRPARYHAPAGTVRRSVTPRRIGTLRPVVVGGGGTVVVKETASSDAGSVQVVPVPVETETPAQTQTPVTSEEEPETQSPVSPGETLHATEGEVPSDADDSMADSPSYKVLGVEDNGLTIVVDVDGQQTKVRMIGLAEPEDDAKDQRPSRRSEDRPGLGGPGRRGGPRLPTNIFLENMLRGEEVYVVYDSMVQEQDEDGKYVAYVYRAPDGMLLNTEILRQGFGVVDPSYDFSEKDTFLYYQDKARKAEKGLWNKSKGPRRNGKPSRRGPAGKPDGMRK